jgi:hypothetical protein
MELCRVEAHNRGMDRDPWTAETVKAGLARFYRGIAGVGLVFPRADRPIAVEFPGYPVVRLRQIDGLEFVEEAVAALGPSLADHLFRQCWAEGTGSDVDLCRAFGWDLEAHAFKVAMAADLVALWHNSRITVDGGPKEVSGGRHAASAA